MKSPTINNGPCCANCFLQKGCSRFDDTVMVAERDFCTRWISSDPPHRGLHDCDPRIWEDDDK